MIWIGKQTYDFAQMKFWSRHCNIQLNTFHTASSQKTVLTPNSIIRSTSFLCICALLCRELQVSGACANFCRE
eukprot:13803603-Ditylum_brightwellii.AAC.1